MPSGVGTQTKYIIEALINTGKFSVVSLGGAVKHRNYEHVRPNKDWTIIPVDGYGTPQIIRDLLTHEKPDILYFMTDPRFYGWLWEMEEEVRSLVPMVYYHVWDNKPYPVYNEPKYMSNDHIACISKVTYDIVKKVCPDVESSYLPHAVNDKIFHPASNKEEAAEVASLKQQLVGDTDKKIFFWNNRNARRKQSGTLIFWFKDFLEQVGYDKAVLVMHTDPLDPHGQNLEYLAQQNELTKDNFMISNVKLDASKLAIFYRAADYTINISDAEGFGLATLESLACGTPIIVTMTGGLQEQVTNGKQWFGFGINPTAKAIIGSQEVPYIYEDRISRKDFLGTMRKALRIKPQKYEAMIEGGMNHVHDNYSFDVFEKTWVDLMLRIHKENGSWDNRKNYQAWSKIVL